ncbi:MULTISPECIES: phosphoribosylglycinamide formyltransferase [Pasteurellaceae]|uniref:Phosphoribosylglycinamide formyltransferase n=1 Tax=Pasteurella atlantica TaxID=2827233 RepID=A0AAW8CFS1_9PAST|nr:phosphoribosylglycinamide formyltransferase [Pasteurella atlantica]MBR0572902.1 phosphoribosylglycinamide formyltransferase [Pasteurella atlantica]MDP8038970.1 phosphoribosylglycinamide formyltransferase [Pasteurella atlantica]MDP8040921.1 phosphoribosylglycinamide formyltransferase [Pasteurella atlantica]MDP8043057.1 phosphoribosylglycinamide formyltransferase [Pasteurella atlantica]MDP8045143.1 phosphoribosylglycinamide formyltransferase [Pasteurella atlantica]
MSKITSKDSIKIAVLVSGGGSNMMQLIKHKIAIDCVVADRSCKATTLAEQYHITTFQVTRENCSQQICEILATRKINLVVLAGFLSILDKDLTDCYTVINIHPSLLPKYGGRGMYGINVHKAVLASGDTISGCTVHYVDAGVDTGDIIAQSEVDISSAKTADEIAKSVLQKEWELLPRVVKEFCTKTLRKS